MIKVIDDFLPSNQFEQISINLMGKDFPWYWNNFVNDRNEQHEHGQFTHGFFNYENTNPWNSIWGELLDGSSTLSHGKSYYESKSKPDPTHSN